jgi:hypothetical protein
MFSAEALVADAKARFGEQVLWDRMRGAFVDGAVDEELADIELLKVAQSVISSFQAVLTAIGSWPLPGDWPADSEDADGTDISGESYADIWPFALQERALGIFNLRTYAGYEEVPANIRDVGLAAETFLVQVQTGETSIEIGALTNVAPPVPLSARNRDGTSNIATAPDQVNTMTAFAGGGWDYF